MTVHALSARRQLQEAPERGALTGFGTLLRKEMGAWWSTRQWWVHALLWLGLMNGFMIPIYFVVLAHPNEGLDMLDQLVKVFFQLGGTTVVIGAIVVGQDAIIGERQMGTAAWIISKPVSRTAFLLAKLVALVFSLAVLAVGLQSVIAYGQISLLAETVLAPVPFLVSVGLLALNLLLYASVVLMLGTLFRTRALVLLVGLGSVFATPLLIDILPWLANVIPFGLTDYGAALNLGMPLSELPLGPVVLALVWTAGSLAVAIRRFSQEEL